MKRILLLALFLLFTAAEVFAYQIETTDLHVYEFTHGKQGSKGVKYNYVYDIDLEQETVTQLGTGQVYKILYDSSFSLTAIRVRPQGEEIIAFKSDGTYSFFMTTYLPKELAGDTLGGHYDVLAYGKYTIKGK